MTLNVGFAIFAASMTVLLIVATKICFSFRITGEYETGFQAGMTASERAPLLSQKDDDLSSWGSVDSMSHDEEELNDSIATPDGKQLKEGDGLKDHRQLCILCSDAFRDCFFLPCGHCAACFTCGKRLVDFTVALIPRKSWILGMVKVILYQCRCHIWKRNLKNLCPSFFFFLPS